jgi:hypothetical protein
MVGDGPDKFEVFLVEDVILTLGNLRSGLAWLAVPEANVPAAQVRAGVARLDAQLALLEERARRVHARLAQGRPETDALRPVFRSCRR